VPPSARSASCAWSLMAARLGWVRYVSSVSDGSLANGLYVHHLEKLEGEGFTSATLDELVVGPF
jgi:hypothetical protein